MGVALQFERGASADDERVIEKGLKRDDKLLPCERAARAAVNSRVQVGRASPHSRNG